MLLFSVGGAFAIWEAVRKILHPGAHTVSLGLTFGVLGAGFVFELASFVVAYRSLRHEKGEATFREYWRDTRDPTLPTVLLEDSAALVSLVVAAVGIGVHHVTGNPLWDALASGVIGSFSSGWRSCLPSRPIRCSSVTRRPRTWKRRSATPSSPTRR